MSLHELGKRVGDFASDKLQPAFGHWTRVEDALPSDGQKVIGATEKYGVRMVVYDVEDQDWIDGMYSVRVTHWMPRPDLPEPPR